MLRVFYVVDVPQEPKAYNLSRQSVGFEVEGIGFRVERRTINSQSPNPKRYT